MPSGVLEPCIPGWTWTIFISAKCVEAQAVESQELQIIILSYTTKEPQWKVMINKEDLKKTQSPKQAALKAFWYLLIEELS